jgi:hypothetical protein
MSQATSRAGRGIIQLPGAANVFRSAVGRLKRPAPVPKIAGIPVARIRHGIAIARDPTRSGANTRYPATSLQENPGVLSEHLRSNDMSTLSPRSSTCRDAGFALNASSIRSISPRQLTPLNFWHDEPLWSGFAPSNE